MPSFFTSPRRAALAAAAALVLVACGASGADVENAGDSVPTTSAEAIPATSAPAVTAPSTSSTPSMPSPTMPAPITTPTQTAAPDVELGVSVIPAGLAGATTIDGDRLDADSLLGRPTVAWFWAPWCVVCRGEAPDVAAVAATFADQVNFVGIAGLGDQGEMQSFVAETGVEGFPHVNDVDGSIWTSYDVYVQPAYGFITADGRLETVSGALGAEALTEIIELLLDA